jgi:hypothetical protein
LAFFNTENYLLGIFGIPGQINVTNKKQDDKKNYYDRDVFFHLYSKQKL